MVTLIHRILTISINQSCSLKLYAAKDKQKKTYRKCMLMKYYIEGSLIFSLPLCLMRYG